MPDLTVLPVDAEEGNAETLTPSLTVDQCQTSAIIAVQAPSSNFA
jgi:flavoprotein